MTEEDHRDFLREVTDALRRHGLDVGDLRSKRGRRAVKVVAIPMSIRDSLEGVGRGSRDQVVMVRLDSKMLDALDLWIQTGVVKSRSEAAALFIKEGLEVRKEELEQLEESFNQFQQAKSKLQEQAQALFGESAGDED